MLARVLHETAVVARLLRARARRVPRGPRTVPWHAGALRQHGPGPAGVWSPSRCPSPTCLCPPQRSSGSWTLHTLHTLQHSTIRTVFSVLLLVLAFCVLTLSGYQVASGQWHATPVLSGSMRPGLQPGDVVLTQRVPISDLHVRDVIVFHPPNEGNGLTVHRIVKLTVKDGTTSITTWGDANPIADPVGDGRRPTFD